MSMSMKKFIPESNIDIRIELIRSYAYNAKAGLDRFMSWLEQEIDVTALINSRNVDRKIAATLGEEVDHNFENFLAADGKVEGSIVFRTDNLSQQQKNGQKLLVKWDKFFIDMSKKKKKSGKILVFVTKNNKFRARVTPKNSYEFEVTVGGESWNNGKGVVYHKRILEICVAKVKALSKQILDTQQFSPSYKQD
jgi:hypothetical protein